VSLPPSFGLGVAVDAARKLARRGAGSDQESFASVLDRNLGTTI
jgi:hypothetical protein